MSRPVLVTSERRLLHVAHAVKRAYTLNYAHKHTHVHTQARTHAHIQQHARTERTSWRAFDEWNEPK